MGVGHEACDSRRLGWNKRECDDGSCGCDEEQSEDEGAADGWVLRSWDAVLWGDVRDEASADSAGVAEEHRL